MNNCTCKKINLKSSETVTGSEIRYSVVLPKDWEYEINNTDMNAGYFDDNAFKYFGVTEMRKEEPWMSLEEQQKDVENKYNVLESGTTDIFKKKSIWNLVEERYDTIPILALYVTIEHPIEDYFYTINVSVSRNEFGKKEICELENVIKSFKLN